MRHLGHPFRFCSGKCLTCLALSSMDKGPGRLEAPSLFAWAWPAQEGKAWKPGSGGPWLRGLSRGKAAGPASTDWGIQSHLGETEGVAVPDQYSRANGRIQISHLISSYFNCDKSQEIYFNCSQSGCTLKSPGEFLKVLILYPVPKMLICWYGHSLEYRNFTSPQG